MHVLLCAVLLSVMVPSTFIAKAQAIPRPVLTVDPPLELSRCSLRATNVQTTGVVDFTAVLTDTQYRIDATQFVTYTLLNGSLQLGKHHLTSFAITQTGQFTVTAHIPRIDRSLYLSYQHATEIRLIGSDGYEMAIRKTWTCVNTHPRWKIYLANVAR